MLHTLARLQSGAINSQTFRSAASTKRAASLSLSKYRDLENVFSSGINTLDLELTEGRYVLSGAADGTVYIHDLHNFSGTPHYTAKAICNLARSNNNYVHRHSVECVQWYPFDTGLFTTSGMDRSMKVWDSNRLKPAEVFTFEGKIYQHHMSTAGSGHCLIAVATSTSEVLLVDLKSGDATHILQGHTRSALTCRWSPCDDHLLATGSCDNRVLIWDVRSSRSCLASLDQNNTKGKGSTDHLAHNGPVNGLCFSSDGHYLVSLGTDNCAWLWNVSTGKNEQVNYGRIPNDTKKAIKLDISVGTSPQLIYVPSEGNVLIYELHSGKRTGVLLGHYNSVYCCAYHPFYQELYSGGGDRNVLVWTADVDQQVAYDEHVKSSASCNHRCHTRTTMQSGDAWSSDED